MKIISQAPNDFCTLKSDSLFSFWFLNKYKTFAPNDFAMMVLAIETCIDQKLSLDAFSARIIPFFSRGGD